MRSAVGTMVTTGLTIGAGLLAYSLAPLHGNHKDIGFAIGIAAVLIVVPLTVVRARAITTSDRPVLDAVETIVLLFTLLVLGFSIVYLIVAEHSGQIAGLHTKIDAVYFTVSTLSTVGFGDVHAAGQAARVIVTLQIVFDLVFIATAVRLLATITQRRVAERRGGAAIETLAPPSPRTNAPD